MDLRKRKLMAINKALHPRDDVDRKAEGTRLTNIEDSVDASIQRLEYYIEKHEGGVITATRNDMDNSNTIRMAITKNKNGKKNSSKGVLND